MIRLGLELAKIADHYGLENQLNQTQEECGELVQAISKYRRKKDIKGLVGEIADVKIMLYQLEYLLGIEDDVLITEALKVERQLGRIKDESTM